LKAVIPAAGMGIRFLPATKSQPKEMLPVADKPVIHHVVEEAVASGINDILIVTGRGKRSIEDYFDKSFELEHVLEKKGEMDYLCQIREISNLAQIYYVRQGEPKGLGDAILCARQFIDNEPFAILLGDVIVKAEIPCTKQLINLYEKHQCSILGIEKVEPEDVQKYGIINGISTEERTYLVRDLIEKPNQDEAPSDLATLGRYILTPEIFDCIEKTPPGIGNEIQLTDAIKLLGRKEKILAYLVLGKRYDIGSVVGWLEANVAFALQDRDLEKDVRKCLKKLLES
jgi:UTP--glucose-1-phosphate uridylyltransferase